METECLLGNSCPATRYQEKNWTCLDPYNVYCTLIRYVQNNRYFFLYLTLINRIEKVSTPACWNAVLRSFWIEQCVISKQWVSCARLRHVRVHFMELFYFLLLVGKDTRKLARWNSCFVWPPLFTHTRWQIGFSHRDNEPCTIIYFVHKVWLRFIVILYMKQLSEIVIFLATEHGNSNINLFRLFRPDQKAIYDSRLPFSPSKPPEQSNPECPLYDGVSRDWCNQSSSLALTLR